MSPSTKHRASLPTMHISKGVVATHFEELPDVYKKMAFKSKITAEEADKHWIIFKHCLAFCAKVRIYGDESQKSQAESESESMNTENAADITGKRLCKLQVSIQAISLIEEATEFGKKIPQLLEEAEQIDIERVLDHPLVLAYIHHATTSWKPSELPFIDLRMPNYTQTAKDTLLNTTDPRSIFKVDKHAEGKGGYGRVYVAKHLDTGTKMIIKKMNHSRAIDIQRNYKEVSIMANCSHPNIVRYYDCYHVEDELWVAMEYLEGGTISDLRRMTIPFDECQIAFLAHECLKGLQYLHELGIAYRDIKPSNIMLTDAYEVKLIDFGLSDSAQAIAEYPKMVGSAAWMAPEMIIHTPQTVKADVWSLGCTLLQLADKYSFSLGEKLQTLFSVATSGRKEFPSKQKAEVLSGNLISFLQAMLQHDPSMRASVGELLEHPFLKQTRITNKSIAPLVNQLLSTRTAFQT